MELNTVNQTNEEMKNFKLDNFLVYKPVTAEASPFGEGYDQTISTLDSAISVKSTIDKILAAKTGDDYLELFADVLADLGLGDLFGTLSDMSGMVADYINNIANIITAFGGPLLERLALLGLIENKCALKNIPAKRRIRLHRLMLDELFKMMNCFGAGKHIKTILEILAPLRDIVIVPEITNNGVYTPAVTNLVRDKQNIDLISSAMGGLLSNNIVENITTLNEMELTDDIIATDMMKKINVGCEQIDPLEHTPILNETIVNFTLKFDFVLPDLCNSDEYTHLIKVLSGSMTNENIVDYSVGDVTEPLSEKEKLILLLS